MVLCGDQRRILIYHLMAPSLRAALPFSVGAPSAGARGARCKTQCQSRFVHMLPDTTTSLPELSEEDVRALRWADMGAQLECDADF